MLYTNAEMKFSYRPCHRLSGFFLKDYSELMAASNRSADRWNFSNTSDSLSEQQGGVSDP